MYFFCIKLQMCLCIFVCDRIVHRKYWGLFLEACCSLAALLLANAARVYDRTGVVSWRSVIHVNVA